VITLQIADPSSRERGRITEMRPQISDSNTPTGSNIFFFLKFQFILQSIVIHLAECYGEEVLQCLGERPSVGPLRR
jgi:hypothetical protein